MYCRTCWRFKRFLINFSDIYFSSNKKFNMFVLGSPLNQRASFWTVFYRDKKIYHLHWIYFNIFQNAGALLLTYLQSKLLCQSWLQYLTANIGFLLFVDATFIILKKNTHLQEQDIVNMIHHEMTWDLYD